GGQRGGGGTTGENTEDTTQTTPAYPRPAVNVQIDFDGLQQRVIAVQGIPQRQYTQLRAGAPGTVYFLEAASGGANGGNTLHRYRLSDRRSAVFVNNVADYDVSADGRKLVYGGGGGGGQRGGGNAGNNAPSLFLVDADRNPPTAGQGRLNVSLRMFLEPKLEF